MIQLDGVWKRFDTTTAVKGVSLTIEGGQLLGLIGPNGAGKTSLLKMIATLSKPDRGTIRIMGLDVRVAVGPIRRRLGYMPAEFGRMPDMTVHEYLSYFGAAAGVPRAERMRRIADVLELVDLVERRDSLVSAGSTGIKQRVLIAKTLVHDPDLLVLDEPAAGLDPRARIEIREVLKELNRLGKTIIVSSHILADLEEICDSVAIMELGSVVAHGGVAELKGSLREGNTRFGWRVCVEPDQVERANELLAGIPGLEDLAQDGEAVHFSTAERNANVVLGELVRANLTVVHFVEEGPRLEDVFMKQTEGTIL
jgi:ABC-2 type transport system ATP-binding protein